MPILDSLAIDEYDQPGSTICVNPHEGVEGTMFPSHVATVAQTTTLKTVNTPP